MTLIVTEGEIAQVLDISSMSHAVDLIDEAYRRKAEGLATLHLRQTIQYPPDTGYYTDSAIRLLPGFLPSMGSAAMRVYPLSHTAPVEDSGPRVLDYVMGQEVLLYYRYDRSMELAAIMADKLIMNLRTAAPTGVATRYMAREDSRVLGVIGAGRHAPWQAAAVCAVRPIEEVRIFSPTAGNRERVARELSTAVHAEVLPVGSARDAVEGADVVVTVTNANAPVIDGEWLADGAHVNVIARGEVDQGTVKRSGLICCSWARQIIEDVPGFSPIPDMLAGGEIDAQDLHDLELAVVGEVGRRDDHEITLFLSQGVGLWDAAVAPWVFAEVSSAGLGIDVDLGT